MIFGKNSSSAAELGGGYEQKLFLGMLESGPLLQCLSQRIHLGHGLTLSPLASAYLVPLRVLVPGQMTHSHRSQSRRNKVHYVHYNHDRRNVKKSSLAATFDTSGVVYGLQVAEGCGMR